MKRVYALLCVLGFVLPYSFFGPFLLAHGLDLPLIVSQLGANSISAAFGADVVVSSLALWALIYHETRQRRISHWWLCVVANLVVGLSLGLPLFLWLREAVIEKERG